MKMNKIIKMNIISVLLLCFSPVLAMDKEPTIEEKSGIPRTALVTGTTSGLGYEAARLLAVEEGYRQVFVTGRTLDRTHEAATHLINETKAEVFTPLELDLDNPTSVKSALDELVKRGERIDFLLLNAGTVGGEKRITEVGVESNQAPLIGHHQLTLGLLHADLLSFNARIVIAGAEPARGDVPMFSYTKVAKFADKYHHGDRTAAVEELLRSGPNVKYEPNQAYANAKVFVAWWAAALARRLPKGMAVYAVSPGSAPDTLASRNVTGLVKWVMMPLVKHLPGMSQTSETATRRYLQASKFGTDVSGQFFASAPGKFTGPMEAMQQSHLHNEKDQEAAWDAIVKVSGVNF
jgi:NAD(P)-dependent dehydrogenase (short-subunit alcohol dehydrogenase family)